MRAHTEQRVAKAATLLEALAELQDPQMALRLLRACAGHTRLVHSMRCNPSSAQHAALATFDGLVRRCFAGFTGIHPTADQWQQAALGFAQAGLGLRCTAAHAPAAYLASLGCSLSACALDASFSAEAVIAHGMLPLPWLPSMPSCQVRGPFPWMLRLAASSASSQSAWTPLDGMPACSLRARLPEPFSSLKPGPGPVPSWPPCPVAEPAWSQPFLELNCAFDWAFLKLLQTLGAHTATEFWTARATAVCVAGGERTQRHNAVRDLVHSWAERAGLRPEKERPGLLLPQSPDDVQAARRRPADVYLPALGGSPAALDFAITAPQRQETLSIAGRATGAAAASYARHKEAHLDTAQCCESQGIVFVPMVVETTGTWEKGAAVVLNHIARAVAARTGEDAGAAQTALMQELSVVVRTWRARAALRRRCEATE